MTYVLAIALVIFFASIAAPGESRWPGATPDCWADARFFHSQEMPDIWKDRTMIRRLRDTKPKAGTYSPNQGYYFTVEGGRPSGAVTIYAEKDYLLRIEFAELFGPCRRQMGQREASFHAAVVGQNSGHRSNLRC